jgi:multidrug transporter EmrE-like cation transporter
MSTGRLIALCVAALTFAVYETGVAYARPDVPNCIWAGIGWVCVLFVAGMWWEARRKK